jgi:predicted SnoaL-like aldol condensation-catalyzing enzyme
MEKPIIATTLSGLFLRHEPWNKAHILWLETAAEKLKDPTIMNWANRPDYFNCVDGIMSRLYPKLTERERTIKAREMYFDSVCQYVQQNPKVRNEAIIKYFTFIKDKYRLALITTNIQSALKKILSSAGLMDLFDITETSLPEEKDDKRIVFDRFVMKYGKPLIYIGGSRKDSFDYCKENKIPCIFANLEAEKDIADVESAHNLEELKEKFKLLSK